MENTWQKTPRPFCCWASFGLIADVCGSRAVAGLWPGRLGEHAGAVGPSFAGAVRLPSVANVERTHATGRN